MLSNQMLFHLSSNINDSDAGPSNWLKPNSNHTQNESDSSKAKSQSLSENSIEPKIKLEKNSDMSEYENPIIKKEPNDLGEYKDDTNTGIYNRLPLILCFLLDIYSLNHGQFYATKICVYTYNIMIMISSKFMKIEFYLNQRVDL